MRRSIMFLLACVAFTVSYAQEELRFPMIQSPTIDGVADSDEWAEAESITLQAGAAEVEVHFGYDEQNLYFKYDLATVNFLFPEIMLDTEHDKASSWQNDDWWFHVSATDCENQGAPWVYDNCEVDQPDWEAMGNWSQSNQPDVVEISISLEKLGGSAGQTESFGLAFMVNNTGGTSFIWPEGSDKDVPESWSSASLSPNLSTAFPTASRLEVFPNPVSDRLKISGLAKGHSVKLELVDHAGHVVLTTGKRVKSDQLEISVKGMPKGHYVLRLSSAKSVSHQNIIIR